MPGMITHYLCGELSAARLVGSGAGDIIERNRQIYNLGTQGPDFFFYYIPCLIRPSIYRLGNVLHSSCVGGFFRSMLEHSLKLEGAEREAALSYICGYLTHYALDCAAHPYIYYKSGFKTEGDSRPSLHYSIMHQNFETNVDIQMLKLATGSKPADKKLWKLINVSRSQAAGAALAISGGLRDVYGVTMGTKQVLRAMYSMVLITRMLQSRTGKRKRLIGSVEGLLMKESGYVSSLIHNQESDDTDYLNLRREPWHYPWDNPQDKETSLQSIAFTDMFQKSVDDSVRLIENFDLLLQEKISLDEFMEMIGDNSFTTGRDCKVKLNLLYHANLAKS